MITKHQKISLEKLHVVRMHDYVRYKARQYFMQNAPIKVISQAKGLTGLLRRLFVG